MVRNILGGIRKMILYRVEKKNTDFWIHVTFLSIFSLEASNIYHFLLMVHRIVQNKCRQVQRFLKTLPYSLLTVIFSFTHTYINQGYQFHFQIILFLSERHYRDTYNLNFTHSKYEDLLQHAGQYCSIEGEARVLQYCPKCCNKSKYFE